MESLTAAARLCLFRLQQRPLREAATNHAASKEAQHVKKSGLALYTGRQPQGYIKPNQLRELWFHTGTRCNLSCSFCLEGSSPASKRLDAPTFEDVKPHIDEALELGVEQFSFTGGEPFVIKDILRILDYAFQHRPCLVLTNGTTPMIKRLEELTPLKTNPHPISFRISIDHPSPERHDADRGEGSFSLALSGLKQLYKKGFHVSVARHMETGENTQAIYPSEFKMQDLSSENCR